MNEKHFKKQTGAIQQILLFFSISLFSILLELKFFFFFFFVKCVVTYNQPIKKYIFMNIIEQSCEKVG
jgi:hypothetical protein